MRRKLKLKLCRFREIILNSDTGLLDKHGREIFDGSMMSLSGNLTADNSLGWLPNGWSFNEEDVYQVRFDLIIDNWSLDLSVEPDSPHNIKYMNHAVSLLHEGDVEITDEG